MAKDDKRRSAILASVQLSGVSDAEHSSSMDELERLVTTLGFKVVGRLSQKRKALSSASVFGEGKLQELAKHTGGTGVIKGFSRKTEANDEDGEELPELDHNLEPIERVGIVVFDLEITPTQLRNLEQSTGAEILDRTGVILEIFSRHARSQEAKIQVEIAKLGYMAPRLRASSVGEDRQGGGIGGKGKGETTHELDKRRIRDRIAELRGQLKTIHSDQGTRRARRQEAPTVALVGYTNAGKSSLMRALTGSEVLVADKLFATLDITVRALQPESIPRVLVSDTVGFIKKLPHDLVSSFRSTLDEALSASLLLFTVDASDASFRSQLKVTQEVIQEIHAGDISSRLVLNKTDRLNTIEINALRAEFPDALLISAHHKDDVKKVRQMIMEFFEEGMVDAEIGLSYAQSHAIGMIRENVKVLEEFSDEQGLRFKIRGFQGAVDKVRKRIEVK